MNLSNYNIIILSNNIVWKSLDYLISNLSHISYKNIYIGNAGLLPEQIKSLKRNKKLRIVELKHKERSETKLSSNDSRYHKIIQQRMPLLKFVYNLDKSPILQLDVDTEILSNNFKHIDTSYDATLSVRYLENSPFGLDDPEYPNCGVIFWNNPSNCIKFWDALYKRWTNIPFQLNIPPEQAHFYTLFKSEIGKTLSWQKLHCKYYNCYNLNWINKDTSIIHCKSKHNVLLQLKSKWKQMNV